MIVIVSGTNRPGSFTQRVARILLEQANKSKAGSSAKTKLLDLIDLKTEIFTPTCYGPKPQWFKDDFQAPISAASGVLFVVPEYNGSFPGVLKYFIDMLEFPLSLKDTPVALVGVAAGQWGALRAVEQLEAILRYRGAYLYLGRLFIPQVSSHVDDTSLGDYQDRGAALIEGFLDFCGKFGSTSDA